MKAEKLFFVWEYNDVDRAFWQEHLEGWLPKRIIDAHIHCGRQQDRRMEMSEALRRQVWVNELNGAIDAPTLARCNAICFPGREVPLVVLGIPSLAFDIEAGNEYTRHECLQRGWYSLAVLRPQWTAEQVAAELDKPGVIGLKPYYSLISHNTETRDEHLEKSIFDFLPHQALEVANDRHAWVTLHVPKADRLGHPENVREVKEIRRRYPNITLVIAHLGRSYTAPHALEALPQFADDPGLYFDSSAVLNPESHRIALEHIGPKRILYGSDNPIFFMRGRRQYSGRTYINRTNHPFYFNKQREAPEIEAKYTLMMYEDIKAIKDGCIALGLGPDAVQNIFHDNAQRLLDKIVSRKASRQK